MFPDLSIIFWSIRICRHLHWKVIWILNSLHTMTTPGTFMMKWLTICWLPQQRETKCCQKKAVYRLRQSAVFFPLAYHTFVANHFVPPSICPGAYYFLESPGNFLGLESNSWIIIHLCLKTEKCIRQKKIKQLCNHKVKDFAMACQAQKVSWALEKCAPSLYILNRQGFLWCHHYLW